MLALDTCLSMEVFLLNIDRGHFSSKIFSLYGDRGEEIGQGSLFGSTYASLHHCCVETKQCAVTFGSDYRESTRIDAALV